MAFAGLNHWAVLLAAAASLALGAIWYRAFAGAWLKATGRGERSPVGGVRAMLPYLYTVPALWLMAFGLAGIIGHLGPGQVTVRHGVISGVACWLTFVITAMLVNDRFARRAPMLLLIDGGYWLAALASMGAIIGWIGV